MKTQILVGLLISVALAANLSTVDYSQVDTNVNIKNFPPYNANALSASSAATDATNQRQFDIIANAQKSLSIPTRSIDSLFSKLPTSAELDELVISADSVSILKTIQTLVTNDAIPCPIAFQYLLELLGRIKLSVQRKEFAVNQLQVIIDAANSEIARLQVEVDALENKKRNLWIEQMQSKIAELTASLQPLYKQFNQVESQIAPNEAKIAGYQQDIQNLRKSNENERNRVSNDRLEIVSVDARISDLENQLKLARERRAYLEASVDKSLQLIAANDKAISDALSRIAEIEGSIRGLRDQADALRAKTTALEVQIERVRDDLSAALAKAETINEQIAEYKDRIAVQQKYLVNDDLANLKKQIAALKNVQVSVDDEVNRQYFYCYGDGAFTVEKTGSTTVYIIRGEAFSALLENTYGISFDDLVCCTDKPESGPKANIPSEIKMQAVDIGGKDYSKINGDAIHKIIGDVNENGHSSKEIVDFDGQFSCIMQEGVSGRGVIVGVHGNRYTVRRFANAGPPLDDFVEVASCTIIMSTVKVPRAGMSMAFTGAKASGFYQANMITVW